MASLELLLEIDVNALNAVAVEREHEVHGVGHVVAGEVVDTVLLARILMRMQVIVRPHAV